MKNIFQRLFKGVKKGLFTPTLPDHILALQKNVFIRLLRVIGGISIILILTHRLEYLGSGLLYLIVLCACTFFSLLFSFYLLYINCYRIKHMYKLLKSDKLDVRNSPFDRFATLSAKLLWCVKGFCEGAAPFGITYGAMAGIDELRRIKGHEPIFLPFLANILIPDNESSEIFNKQRKLTADLVKNKLESGAYTQELGIVNELLEKNVITNDEAIQWQRDILNNNSLLNQNTEDIKGQIQKNLEKLNELRNNRNK